MCILALSQMIFYNGYYSKPQKEQYREAIQYVVEQDSLYKNAIAIGNSYFGGEFLITTLRG
jgi:hypothetical protein